MVCTIMKMVHLLQNASSAFSVTVYTHPTSNSPIWHHNHVHCLRELEMIHVSSCVCADIPYENMAQTNPSTDPHNITHSTHTHTYAHVSPHQLQLQWMNIGVYYTLVPCTRTDIPQTEHWKVGFQCVLAYSTPIFTSLAPINCNFFLFVQVFDTFVI